MTEYRVVAYSDHVLFLIIVVYFLVGLGGGGGGGGGGRRGDMGEPVEQVRDEVWLEGWRGVNVLCCG